jgi:hypothetical protein
VAFEAQIVQLMGINEHSIYAIAVGTCSREIRQMLRAPRLVIGKVSPRPLNASIRSDAPKICAGILAEENVEVALGAARSWRCQVLALSGLGAVRSWVGDSSGLLDAPRPGTMTVNGAESAG